ncbi:peptidyl-prolyl cis-trans isomerase [Acidipila sp. EB88]|uniref:peptidylprolyl isomerase n=1 Tax=Acidipila sp. EB88 TaxID=2305226 RepID=UPI000F5EBEA5|nr:peptidyl-prolyl cis-trans isomerase [Acidipila sp. EB88]RRA48671.1 peptidylprolyl isomerase [Acidipila sp. EB88]
MISRIPLFQASLLAAATIALAAVVVPSRPALAQSVSPVSKNAAAAAPESPYHGTVVADIVARVNDQVISSADFARAEQELESQARQRNMSPSELEDQKKQLLRDLIDNQLLLSKGKQLGITGEAETIRQLDDLRKQNNLDSMEALEKAAEQQGVSFADFKASIQNRVITSQVIRDEVGRRISITQGDEQQYYDAHKDQFMTPEQVKLSEILVPTADADNAADVAKAQSKADDLETQLKGGKDFAELAKASSGGSTAAQGGELGDYKRGQLPKVLEDDTFSLKTGEYTAPIRTKQGFVILKVNAHTDAGQQPFSAVQPQVEDAIGMQKMQPALRSYLTRLREEAYIDIKPGFVDASSSGNETRPIFSAYQPPVPKKKKKQERTRFAGRGRTRNSVLRAKSAPAPAAQPAPPVGVPSLADVNSQNAATPAVGATPGAAMASGTNGAAATPGNTAAAPATTTTPTTTTQTASAKTAKPGKREKVRFGQAPRETLPAADTRAQDAGASTANGNASNAETAAVSQPGAPAGAVGQNVRYGTGESAAEEQAPEAKKQKTRFSSRVETRKQKAEKKRLAKADPYPAPAPDSQEIADKSVQSKPLGLAGTTKPAPKPKPTTKTRYSDEAAKKNQVPADSQGGGTLSTGDNSRNAGTSDAQAPVSAVPYKEPSPQNPPGSDAPHSTQTTPTGSGDPINPVTPAPSSTQPPTQPQR